MLATWTVPFLLLAAYVLLASAAISDKDGLLCARQRPAHLHFDQHRIHQQQMSLQPAIELASSTLSLTVAFTSLSFNLTDIRTLAQDSTRTNSTKLTHGSNGSWSKNPGSVSKQGETLNDGLISHIKNLDLAKDTGDSEETSVEQQHNDAANASNEEECPSGFDTLDCKDCGGPEHTWEVNPWHFHCKGIEAEGYKWKECYCMNPDPRRGPCTFDNRAEEICEYETALEGDLDSPGKSENIQVVSGRWSAEQYGQSIGQRRLP